MAQENKWTAILLFCTLFMMSTEVRAGNISLEQSDGIDYITIEGDVVASDLAHFQRLAVSSEKAVVVLGSPGGALSPALEIGKIIRLKGFGTYVPDGAECTSACALIWIAGQPRMLSPTSRVGFHASYVIENGRQLETGQGNAMVGRYLTLLNLPERAVIFATRAAPDRIEWIDPRDPISSGIDFKLIEIGPDDVAVPARSGAGETSPIIARDEFEWESGAWIVLSTSDREGCFAVAQFTSEKGQPNSSSIRISKDRHENVGTLAFDNERFKSIKDGEIYRLSIVFQTGETLDDGWGEKEFVGTHLQSGMQGLVTFLEWEDLAEDFRQEENVGFYLDNELVDVFPLTGSARAMQELDKCLSAAGPKRLSDPFE